MQGTVKRLRAATFSDGNVHFTLSAAPFVYLKRQARPADFLTLYCIASKPQNAEGAMGLVAQISVALSSSARKLLGGTVQLPINGVAMEYLVVMEPICLWRRQRFSF